MIFTPQGSGMILTQAPMNSHALKMKITLWWFIDRWIKSTFKSGIWKNF